MIEHHAHLVYTRNDVHTFVIPAFDTDFEVLDQFHEQIGIDTVRELIQSANRQPIDASTLLLVTRANSITLESQHALLKLLEEPPTTTRLVFVFPKETYVLPTVLSRVVVTNEVSEQSENELFRAFLQAGYADRLAQIEKATKAKDIMWQQHMKNGLVAYITQTQIPVAQKKRLEFCARWLLTRGASNKMLLEQTALQLPLVK